MPPKLPDRPEQMEVGEQYETGIEGETVTVEVTSNDGSTVGYEVID
jgi:hypothetical protein